MASPPPSMIDAAFLLDDDPLGPAELIELNVFQLDAQILADKRAAREGRDVAEHRLAAIAETGGLHRTDRQARLNAIDHQHGQRFAFNVFRNDQERLARSRRPFAGSATDRGRWRSSFRK